MPLANSLRKSGLAFFMIELVLRLANIFAAIYIRPSLVFLTLLCVPQYPLVVPADTRSLVLSGRL